jgi:hypothetical protein
VVVGVLDDVVHKVRADEAGTAGDEKIHAPILARGLWSGFQRGAIASITTSKRPGRESSAAGLGARPCVSGGWGATDLANSHRSW